MSYRSFTDSRGTPWRVWEVHPTPVDRRFAIRRIQAAKIHHPERRLLPDRRVDMRRSRLFFPASEPGWLLFETGSTRRRLRPVPDRWVERDEASLEELCLQAEASLSPPR